MLVNKFTSAFNENGEAEFSPGNATILAIGTVDDALNGVTIKATTDGGKKIRISDEDTAEWSLAIVTDSAGSYFPLNNPIQLAAARSVTFTTESEVENEELIIYTKELG